MFKRIVQKLTAAVAPGGTFVLKERVDLFATPAGGHVIYGPDNIARYAPDDFQVVVTRQANGQGEGVATITWGAGLPALSIGNELLIGLVKIDNIGL